MRAAGRIGAVIGMAVAALAATDAVSQGLPVKIHKEIRTFRGAPGQIILRTEDAAYQLYSAHKEGGRPWADAIFIRQGGRGDAYLARAYDCARGTWRWMGEANRVAFLSQSVRSIDDIQPRPAEPGTLEYELARYACGL